MSAHFTLRELRCKDGSGVPAHLVGNAERLMASLEVIRAADGGRGLKVVSGYRSPAWNAKKQGARLSRHMTAEAADVRPIVRVGGVAVPWLLVRDKRSVIAAFHEMVLRMVQEGELPDVGGVGLYPGAWLHIDVRPRLGGHLAQWTGYGIGSEVA